MTDTEKNEIAIQALQADRMLAVKIEHEMYLLVVLRITDGRVEGLNIEFDDEGRVRLTKQELDLRLAAKVMLRGHIPDDVRFALNQSRSSQ